MKKIVALILAGLLLLSLCGCDDENPASGTEKNIQDTQGVTDELTMGQPTPTDIDYSLERYNLIRRAYWVNGQRQKADTLPCEVEKPLGYIVLFTEGGGVVGRFIVDGKVSSLNSFLSPDYIEERWGLCEFVYNTELADVDGSYGENDNGIFFFTPDGKYVEWTGTYLYSDIPFELDAPTVLTQEAG
ncbi:hypothetical protein [uncultured Dysosmobacter sp.]|uniref:hypothetical protein n=1 Tax=uncultured Dysosmobacter sp. TaxID=2591384 RepID=UPI002632445E|nr:hypothetical protein [uncultured Dysosmobacter sp.]